LRLPTLLADSPGRVHRLLLLAPTGSAGQLFLLRHLLMVLLGGQDAGGGLLNIAPFSGARLVLRGRLVLRVRALGGGLSLRARGAPRWRQPVLVLKHAPLKKRSHGVAGVVPVFPPE